jgi:hypothetical protein
VSTMGWFKCRTSVWLSALGIVLALVGLLIATAESLRHGERVAPIAGAAQSGNPASDSLSSDAGRRPGSSIWMTP